MNETKQNNMAWGRTNSLGIKDNIPAKQIPDYILSIKQERDTETMKQSENKKKFLEIKIAIAKKINIGLDVKFERTFQQIKQKHNEKMKKKI